MPKQPRKRRTWIFRIVAGIGAIGAVICFYTAIWCPHLTLAYHWNTVWIDGYRDGLRFTVIVQNLPITHRWAESLECDYRTDLDRGGNPGLSWGYYDRIRWTIGRWGFLYSASPHDEAGLMWGYTRATIRRDPHANWGPSDRIRDFRLAVPIWVVLPVCLTPLGVMWERRRRRRPEGICRRCGYDLRASPGRCPECGDFSEARQSALVRGGARSGGGANLAVTPPGPSAPSLRNYLKTPAGVDGGTTAARRPVG